MIEMNLGKYIFRNQFIIGARMKLGHNTQYPHSYTYKYKWSVLTILAASRFGNDECAYEMVESNNEINGPA